MSDARIFSRFALEVLALAQKFGLVHVRAKDADFEIEATLAPPSPPPVVTPDDDLCSCGHSLEVEHNESGCLHGCSITLCTGKKG